MDALENKGYRKILYCLPRRSGKDILAFNIVIRQALKRIGIYYYIFPTYSQGKKALFDAITISGVKFTDYIPRELISSCNSQEMKITLTNNSIIQVLGSTDYDRVRGTNPVGVVFSEFATQDPTAFSVLRPVLIANNGWFIIESTPNGENHFYDMYQIAKNSDDWFSYFLTVDDTKHISINEIEKDIHDGVMSRDMAQQEYWCFPPGQNVLTNNGLKKINEINYGDIVVTHTGRLRRVMCTMSKKYEGDLISIYSYGSFEPIVCTPNHPVRIYDKNSQNYSWVAAEKITNKNMVVFPKMILGKQRFISYDLCMLLAWYITEGSSFKNGLQFSVGTEKEVARVRYLLDMLGLKSVVYKKKGFDVVTNSVKLIDFFRDNCGSVSSDRRIPFPLISGYEKEFFPELIKGDGCLSEYKGRLKYCYATISKTLAYQVQLLANSLNSNLAAGVTWRKGGLKEIQGRTVACRDSYCVNISIKQKGCCDSSLHRAKYCIAAKIKKITKKPYTGKVYNLKVQYDESYLVSGRAVHNCSFSIGATGSYYNKYINNMKLDGHIGDYPWESSFKVNTAWDLGMSDSMIILFFQVIGTSIRIIDCIEGTGKGLEAYAKILDSKPYQYDRHIAPHDIKVRELGTGMSRLEKAKRLGIRFTLAPNLSIEDGREAVRSLFSKLRIDKIKCEKFIKAIKLYRKEYDTKKKRYKDVHLHDWTSDWADALRYLAISLPKCRDGLSSEDIDKNYREVKYGNQSNMPDFFRDDYPKY